jgi:hypothetical protein
VQTPPLTVEELLDQNRQLRESHKREVAALQTQLRDDFAKAALPAVLDIESTASGELGRTTYSADAVAKECYAIADAMLRARAVTS